MMTFERIEINGRLIGEGQPPYVIAELSANHNGSIERAKESIKAAKKSGADAVKIQTYTPDTMTIECTADDFLVKGGLWDGYSLYELYKQAHTPFEWHEELFSLARELGITIFSSPFDESAVDLLESLNAPAYKIASFELIDIPLIKYAASKGKPLLMSTGMAGDSEIEEAIDAARSAGCDSLLLFHCISSYPAEIADANLARIPYLKRKFGVQVGLSDHTIGNLAASLATMLGASAIEKHFTLSRGDEGPDSSFSMEPDELEGLMFDTRQAFSALGAGGDTRPSSESGNLVFRRSLYFVKDIPEGETIQPHHVRRIRPGYGLAPKHFDTVIGRVVNRNIHAGDRVSWDVFEE